MAHPSMVRLGAILHILLLAVLLAKGASQPKAKKVKCKDKKFSKCYHKDLYCPKSCLRTCFVDCKKCKAVCEAPPPPPPPPPPPSRHKRRYPPPPPKTYPSPPPAPSVVPPPPPSTTTSPLSPLSLPRYHHHCLLLLSHHHLLCILLRHCLHQRPPVERESNARTRTTLIAMVWSRVVLVGALSNVKLTALHAVPFVRDQDFCLVSDSNIHINAHFIGKRDQNMKRDFTWVQSLGILFDNRKLFIGAKSTSTWDDSVDRLIVAIDDETISLADNEGAYWQSQGLRITRSKNTNAVEIEAKGNFRIKAVVVPITEKESVIHKMGVMMPVLGGNREFSSSSIFASDCAVARFSGEFSEKAKQYASTMNCASGMDGRGVVCKR
ncbi:hypothetical protein ACLB2K_049308 [Fragaria x ananassa]